MSSAGSFELLRTRFSTRTPFLHTWAVSCTQIGYQDTSYQIPFSMRAGMVRRSGGQWRCIPARRSQNISNHTCRSSHGERLPPIWHRPRRGTSGESPPHIPFVSPCCSTMKTLVYPSVVRRRGTRGKEGEDVLLRWSPWSYYHRSLIPFETKHVSHSGQGFPRPFGTHHLLFNAKTLSHISFSS